MVIANEMVKYRNDLNEVPFRRFNRREFNIFFAIVSRMRGQKSNDVTFNYDYLMKLTGINYHAHIAKFTHDLENTYRKLQRITLYQDTPKYFRSIVLFDEFKIDKVHHMCTVSVNPKLVGVLNSLVNWTRFSLAQFARLKSGYSKTMFRLIKQYRTTGLLVLPNRKFRQLLCVPKSYSSNAVWERCIKPIEIELTPLVHGLHIKRIQKGQSHRVTGYRITFRPELNKQDDFSRGTFKDKDIMLRNIEFNDFIKPAWKKEALKRVKRAYSPFPHKRKRGEHEPDKQFHQMLKSAPIEALKMYLKMYQKNNPTVHFSKYQARLLRKKIESK